MGEFKKQLIDQPLHALWGFSTGILPFAANLLGIGAAFAGFLVSCASLTGWFLRERWQWVDPDSPRAHLLWPGAPDWLDPALDSAVYAMALFGGVLTGIYAL